MLLLQEASKFYTIFYTQLKFSKLTFLHSYSFLYLVIQHKFSMTQLQDKTGQKIPSKIKTKQKKPSTNLLCTSKTLLCPLIKQPNNMSSM